MNQISKLGNIFRIKKDFTICKEYENLFESMEYREKYVRTL